MSDVGGLQKHEKTQQTLVGLGSAALAAAVAFPGNPGTRIQSQDWYDIHDLFSLLQHV